MAHRPLVVVLCATDQGEENRQPVTAAKFINKSSLFVLQFGFIRRLKLKPISEQKDENIFVARHIAKPPVMRRIRNGA